MELGLAAFAPALALLAARCWSEPWIAIPAVVLACSGVLATIGALVVLRHINEEPFEFEEIEDAGPEVVGHVTSYVIPVVVDSTQSAGQMAIATFAMGLIVLVHIASGRVLVSPLLYLAGRRAYVASTASGVSYFIVARSDPALWTGPIRCRPLGSAILVEGRDAR